MSSIDSIERLSAIANDKSELLEYHRAHMNAADSDAWELELALNRDAAGAQFAQLQKFRLDHFMMRNLLTAI